VLPDGGGDGKGGSSDILGVVAMMMNGGKVGGGSGEVSGKSAPVKSGGVTDSGKSDYTRVGVPDVGDGMGDLGSMIKDTTFYEDPSLYASETRGAGGQRIRRNSSMRF
jgi:hypothetical protein